MTQRIASLLPRNGSHRKVACLQTDRLMIQVMKVPRIRRLPPYVLTLDLASLVPQGGKTRMAEIRGDTPQACASLLGQLLAIATEQFPSPSAGPPAPNA